MAQNVAQIIYKLRDRDSKRGNSGLPREISGMLNPRYAPVSRVK